MHEREFVNTKAILLVRVIGKVVRTSVEEANLKEIRVDIDSLEAIADPYINGYYKGKEW